jgi:hypothetical protein
MSPRSGPPRFVSTDGRLRLAPKPSSLNKFRPSKQVAPLQQAMVRQPRSPWIQTGSVTPQVFSRVYLTPKIRSTELTLFKRRSTWAITSKTSPTTPNDTPWSTHGQGWVKILVKPLKRPLTLLYRPEFCRVLQISPKHFKFSQCKSCVFCRGTQLSC